MRTLVFTTTAFALALFLMSFVPGPVTGDAPKLGASISTLDMTLAAGPLASAEYVDAH